MAKKNKIEIPLFDSTGGYNKLYLVQFGEMSIDIINWIIDYTGIPYIKDDDDLFIAVSMFHNNRCLKTRLPVAIGIYLSHFNNFQKSKVNQKIAAELYNTAAEGNWQGLNLSWDRCQNIINGTQQQQPQQPTQKSGNTNNINNLFSSI